MICPKCNSEKVIDGFVSGNYGVRFIKKGTENKLKPESYKIECKACIDCGHMFDFEIELKEKKLRLEDALNATRCAMTSGIIEGGGKVLYEISEQITTVKRYPEFNVALDILNKVLKEPFRQIIRNSGEEVDKIEKRVNHNLWYDASTSNIVNLKPAGIIDPTSVTKSVITTAVSIASVFLTTECAIVNTEQAKLNEEELV